MGIRIKVEGYVITSNSHCFIVNKQKSRINKEGDREKYLSPVSYHGTLASVLNGILQHKLLVSNVRKIKELKELIEKTHKKLVKLFEGMEFTEPQKNVKKKEKTIRRKLI